MNGALFAARTGLAAQDLALRTISNNLANANTDGFKRDRAVFEDLMYQVQRQPGAQSSENAQLPSGLQLGTGVRTVGTQKLFTQGTIEVTEQNLDMAIQGRGFFQLTTPNGDLAYSRQGQFQLNSDGDIVNAQGLRLEPQISIPPDTTSITIGADGTLSVTQGESEVSTELGQIQLADFVNPAGLLAQGGNLYSETAASGAPIVGIASENGLGGIVQGSLENSNVNSVSELVEMIQTQRTFEMNSKVISTADQMLSFVTQQL